MYCRFGVSVYDIDLMAGREKLFNSNNIKNDKWSEEGEEQKKVARKNFKLTQVFPLCELIK